MEFLNKNFRYAIVGASANKNKWGYKVFKYLIKSGFKVFPVNPKYSNIDGIKCYASLKELKDIDVVITIVNPKITKEIIQLCYELGIKRIWMQPGSESDENIELCKKLGISAKHGQCLLIHNIN